MKLLIQHLHFRNEKPAKQTENFGWILELKYYNVNALYQSNSLSELRQLSFQSVFFFFRKVIPIFYLGIENLKQWDPLRLT